jgi:PTS system glucose-specific IIC component
MIGSSGILMGLGLAMIKNVDPDKRKKYASMIGAAMFAVFLTGVTEPLEYMFMFVAMPLYAVYAVVQGLAFASADFWTQRVHSFGNIELLTRTPLTLNAGLGMDLLHYLITTVVFGVVMYFLANFMIRKFNYATPGRNGNYDAESDSSQSASSTSAVDADAQVIDIINALGGRQNIQDVDACMTRLRVTVKDEAHVQNEVIWKKLGASGLVKKGKGIQAVYGPKADVLKSDIQDLLDSGAEIPASNFDEKVSTPESYQAQPTRQAVAEDIFAVATGRLIAIDQVQDAVFSQKMMGDGFAIQPSHGEVTSPVHGTVTSIFPTQHALGIVTPEGAEVLVHMGLDTVELNGEPFDVLVKEGEVVTPQTTLAHMNIDQILQKGKQTDIVVAFTNVDKIAGIAFDVEQQGQEVRVDKRDHIGSVLVK